MIGEYEGVCYGLGGRRARGGVGRGKRRREEWREGEGGDEGLLPSVNIHSV